MPQTANKANFTQIRSWLNEIHREKSAKAKSERGGYMGETTHPIKDVDDGLHDSQSGAHNSEQEKYQKDRPVAGIVEDTAEGGSPKQEDLALNIGVKAMPTGEAPEVEDNYKGKIKDPGTTSEMNADKLGDKYGSWIKKEASELAHLANDILADIATGVGLNTTTISTTNKSASHTVSPSTQTVTPQTAVTAGYELAGLLGMDKASADANTELVVSEMIKQAQSSADRVGAYLISFMQETQNLQKHAAGELPPDVGGAGPMPPPGPGGDAGMIPPGGDAVAPPMPPPGAGGEAPPPDAGEMMPPGVGAEGGAGGHEQALQELAMALMELGISPEELQQLAAGGGGAGGAGPEGGAGAPPPPGGPADMGQKIASSVRDYKRSGRFRVTEAKTAAQQDQRREMKRYVLEIVGATR